MRFFLLSITLLFPFSWLLRKKFFALLILPLLLYFISHLIKSLKSKNKESLYSAKRIGVSFLLLTLLITACAVNIYRYNQTTITQPKMQKETNKEVVKKEPQKVTLIKVKLPDKESYTNIRLEKSKDSQIIAKAYNGDVLEYSAHEDGWYKVALEEGKEGWIHEKYALKVK